MKQTIINIAKENYLFNDAEIETIANEMIENYSFETYDEINETIDNVAFELFK